MRALLIVFLLAGCAIENDLLPSQRVLGESEDGVAYDPWRMKGGVSGLVDDDLDLPDGVVD